MVPIMGKAGLRGDPGDPERERAVVVADKGLNTFANIARATLDGNGFVLSQSVRRATRGLREGVLDVGRATGARPSDADVQGALSNMVGHRLDRNAYFFDYRSDLTDALCGPFGTAPQVHARKWYLPAGTCPVGPVVSDARK